MNTYLNSFINLIYPAICTICNQGLAKGERSICIQCVDDFPRITNTSFVENKFKGQINYNFAFSMYAYERNSKISRALKSLKYDQNNEIGLFLGEKLGLELHKHNLLNDIDVLIPVPVTNQRLKKRGYNQAEIICNGIQKISNIEIESQILKRNSFFKSQTKLNRNLRFENIDKVFYCDSKDLENKKILLIDDVLTTGATLISCAEALYNKGVAEISIATICNAI